MKIAVRFKNTPGEIHNVSCPNLEFEVLKILKDKELTGPQISRNSDGKISISSIYKLLKRLEDRGLVIRRTIQVKSEDISLNRVVYSEAFDSLTLK